MVFDREGNLVRAGAERDMHGEPVAGGWLHSGEVDWDGNVWVVERMNHRILKFDPTLERALLQIGTTGEPGNDATHLNSPSGILFTREGNIVVTDGYGNNRVALYRPDGTFIKQVGQGTWRAGRQGRRTRRVGSAASGRGRCRRQPLSDRPGEPPGPGVRQPVELRPRVRQRGVEPLGHRHLAAGRRRLRLHRRPRRRAGPQDRARRRPHSGHLGRARPWARGSSTGSMAWPWTPRARSTRPTPTANACRSSCRSLASVSVLPPARDRGRVPFAPDSEGTRPIAYETLKDARPDSSWTATARRAARGHPDGAGRVAKPLRPGGSATRGRRGRLKSRR